MKLLITGASGFLGGFIVENALEQGHEVIAAIRQTSSKQYLQDERIQFVELNLSDRRICTEELTSLKANFGSIDAVIHNAGVTKALNVSAYETVNYDYTKNLIESIKASDTKLQKFVYISSLAAAGPGRADTDIAITTSDENNPVTAYGKSKLKSEEYIKGVANFPYVILRPPAVFGPRDTDMFEVFSMVNRGFETFVGRSTQHLSFIYVKDLAEAIVNSALSTHKNKTYFVSDNVNYTSLIFSNLVKKSMGKKTFVVKLPVLIVYIVAFMAEMTSKLTKKPSPLNVEKIKELKCTNWLCDASDFHRDMNFAAKYTLESGIVETIKWYKINNWL